MTPVPLLNTRTYTLRPCWLSADSLDACVATPQCLAIRTQRRKISPEKMLGARSRPRCCAYYEATLRALSLLFKTHSPEPVAKSP